MCQWLRLRVMSGLAFAVSANDDGPPLCSAAILSAARYGDLLQLDASLEVEPPNCVDSKTRQTPLHVAAEAGQMDVALRLLAVGALMDRDYWGRAPLHSAVDAGRIEMTSLLLDAGAHIELLDDARLTPLHHAARRGHLETVKLLLDRGALVDALENDGRAPLHYTCRGDEFLNVTKELINRGADMERPDAIGFRPMHVACYQNQLHTAQHLLSLSADLYAMDRAGWNPLVHAAANDHKELTMWLVDETLKPRTFPLPDPEKMWKPDMGAPVFMGMQAWLIAFIIVGTAVVLLIIPALCVMRRFAQVKKPYQVNVSDLDIEEFIHEVFSLIEKRQKSTKKVCQEWDKVPAHTLQDLHRVKSFKAS